MVGYKTYGYETILNHRSCCPYAGKEVTQHSNDDDIMVFSNRYGSFRFVLYEKYGKVLDSGKRRRRAISAAQVLIFDENGKIRPEVVNVITVEKYRSQGHAMRVFKEIVKHFPKIQFSRNRSVFGQRYVHRCTEYLKTIKQPEK